MPRLFCATLRTFRLGATTSRRRSEHARQRKDDDVMQGRLWTTAAVMWSLGCGGTITEALTAGPVDVTAIASMVDVAATPAFADERGGGLFIDLAGRVVRLRSDGTRAALESHPQNPIPPGAASSIWPLGPFTALVVTDRGLFVADSGWLIAPPWQTRLSAEGFLSSATGLDGVAWIAHQDGLFRVEGGSLKELKANGQPITGITALAIAPATDLRPGVWFAQGSTVSVAAQTSTSTFSIRDSGLTAEELAGGVRGIAGITASHVLSGDFDIALEPNACLNNVIQTTKPGSIVVFHDSAKAWDRLYYTLPAFLKYCHQKGWNMKKLNF